MNILAQAYERNKSRLNFSLLATFLWGLAAHGYRYLNSDFTHDSLKELHGGILGNAWKIELGRVFVPIYRNLVRGDLTIPWLIGLLTLLMLGLSVFVMVKIFNIESKGLIFLTAGIVVANRSITAITATYLHDLDCYALTVLFMTAAVYLWQQHKWGFLPGAVLVAGALGIYQSYISITITLAMFVCIFQLLEGEKFFDVFYRGIRAIAMLLIGGGLYFVAMKVIQNYTGIAMATGGYNTLDVPLALTPERIVYLVKECYWDCLYRLLLATSTYPARVVEGITKVLLLAAAAILAMALVNKKVGWAEKILCVVLLGLLPLGMNIVFVIANGGVHDLMVFAVWLMYFLVMLLVSRFVKSLGKPGWAVRGLVCAMIAVLLYGNVQYANGLYLKKDFEYDAYLSLMTRVTDRLEQQEGYVPGQTPVFFAGLPDNLNDGISGFEIYHDIVGGEYTDVIRVGKRERYQLYYDYVLGTPIQLAETSQWNQLREDPRVEAMPSFPIDGCISELDGVVVVKLGDYLE